MKKSILLFLLFINIFYINSQIAIIKSCSGDIKIIQGKQEVMAKSYFVIKETSTIIMGKDSYMTLFFKNGDTVTLNGVNKFEISSNGLKPLIKETEAYLLAINKTYTAKDTLSSRGKEKVPEEVLKEIKEIEENVSDPALQALLKGECYKRNNLPVKASSEFNKHKKLTEEQK